jgi:hypothetical protein
MKNAAFKEQCCMFFFVGYLLMFQGLDYIVLDGRMTDKIGKDLEGSGPGLIKVLSQHFPGRAGETMETSVSISSVSAKIRIEHLPHRYKSRALSLDQTF